MFDRHDGGQAAVLVSLDFGHAGYADSLTELEHLTTSAGLEVKAIVEGRRAKPDAAMQRYSSAAARRTRLRPRCGPTRRRWRSSITSCPRRSSAISKKRSNAGLPTAPV
jgi:hypothetical protein